MKKAIFVLALIAAVYSIPAPAYAGPCDHSWDRASDGSRCGDRAADRREGGR